jgi:hypothetical protein
VNRTIAITGSRLHERPRGSQYRFFWIRIELPIQEIRCWYQRSCKGTDHNGLYPSIIRWLITPTAANRRDSRKQRIQAGRSLRRMREISSDSRAEIKRASVRFSVHCVLRFLLLKRQQTANDIYAVVNRTMPSCWMLLPTLVFENYGADRLLSFSALRCFSDDSCKLMRLSCVLLPVGGQPYSVTATVTIAVVSLGSDAVVGRRGLSAVVC